MAVSKGATSRLSTFRYVAVAAGLLGLAACSGSSGAGASGEDEVVLRFSWWGSDVRHQLTQDVIDAYEEQNPGVRIEGEYGDFNGYWDKLATQVAANDAPDIIQMDLEYIREYAGRGALADLRETDIDISEFDDSVIAPGEFDGGLWGLTNGINLAVVIANPALIEEAGQQLPDDTSWTWDDWVELNAAITEGTEDGVYGSESPTRDPELLEMWLRQHGASLYTQEGGLGFTAEDAAGFFEFLLRATEEGAVTTPSLAQENNAADNAQRDLPTGRAAMGFWWSNQLTAVEETLGREARLLRIPSADGTPESAQQWYRASQFWSISARSEHPEEAADFVDFLANSEEAAGTLLAERGVIPNNALREQFSSELSDTDQRSTDFVTQVEDELGPPTAPTPIGLGGDAFPFTRYTSEVLFGRMTPQEAAEALIAEAEANMASS
ncbi:ABC transporter substrate-binding protein [Ornithinicoccus halotolerans]|uniref:ABC transporter substrate-binding protein n=1 Tax=Ornithinicoccus halotolerans TaxID=1748220 RepID=UPI001296B7AC|nr:extracellular solute-binding protein [Ornithinicoccus halotolerans]